MTVRYSYLWLCAALLLAACATPRRQAGAGGADLPSGGIPSHWEGEWRSAQHRGMHGRLRCFLTKIDNRHYRARFRANWLAFASSYTVVLETRPMGRGLRLHGTHELRGIGGGRYDYEGNVTSRRFTATYHSTYDSGIFSMSPRPD